MRGDEVRVEEGLRKSVVVVGNLKCISCLTDSHDAMLESCVSRKGLVNISIARPHRSLYTIQFR